MTNDYKLYRRIQQLKCDSRAYAENIEREYGYMELEEVGEVHGTNYNLSEFQAAVLLENLKKLDAQNEIRRKNGEYLSARLAEIDGVHLVTPYEKNTDITYYGYIIPFDKAKFNNMTSKEIIIKLREKLNIGSFYMHPLYPAIHKSPLFCPWTNRRYIKEVAQTEEYWRNQSFPVAEAATENTIFYVTFHLIAG